MSKRPLPYWPRIMSNIGSALRARYDDTVNEPLPAKLQELLRRLEAAEGRR